MPCDDVRCSRACWPPRSARRAFACHWLTPLTTGASSSSSSRLKAAGTRRASAIPRPITPGKLVINHWAQYDDIRQVGNLFYGPFANNVAFFEKYYQRMLVINGVDAQTNSHSVGIVHNWSGRNSEGYPTLSALLAAYYAPALPISYLSFGGFSATSGITRFTRIDNAGLLRDIAYPAGDLFSDADWAALESYRAATAERRAATPNLLPASERYLAFYQSAFMTEGLKDYAEAIPPEDQLEEWEEGVNGHDSTLRRQAQLTVLAFKTRVAVSADLYLGGFDTHANHDPDHEWLLGNLTSGVDYLWEYAEAHGVADRLVVVVGSDFGRTYYYNSQSGKDHWPIGSYIIMEKNQPWTNRVVGETDELHFAYRIDPHNLRRNDQGGAIIYPKHVHKALRPLPWHRAFGWQFAVFVQQHRGFRVLWLAVKSPSLTCPSTVYGHWWYGLDWGRVDVFLDVFQLLGLPPHRAGLGGRAGGYDDGLPLPVFVGTDGTAIETFNIGEPQ